MSENGHILEVRDLCKDFSGLEVLAGVCFQVAPGERHAVIGPNGAGKTTLFNVITGKYKPSSGKILFRGRDITGMAPHQLCRMKISRSFQITNAFQDLSVFENIRSGVRSLCGLRYHFLRRVDRNEGVNRRTEELVELVGLSAVRDALVNTLSYGQQRALEIGLALSTDPELILLDEPTAGMTREETAEAIKLIDRVTRGKSLIIIEHDMDVVFSLADRISVLHYGSILASGEPDAIRHDQRVKDAYLGEG